MSCEKPEDLVTLLWTIENFNKDFAHDLYSPIFLSNSLDGTSWKISLVRTTENYISLKLTRCVSQWREIKRIILDCELSIIEENGQTLALKHEKKHGFVICHSLSTRETFLSKDSILGGVLFVRCQMWRSSNKMTEQELLITDTKIGRHFFVWEIDNFSNLKPKEIEEIHVINSVKETPILNYNFYNVEASDITIFEIESVPKNVCFMLFFKIKALDCSGVEFHSEQHYGTLHYGIFQRFYSLLKISELLQNRRKYLPMDTLLLRVDCFFWTCDPLTNYSYIPMQNLQICENLPSELSASNVNAGYILPILKCDKQSMTETENSASDFYKHEKTLEIEKCDVISDMHHTLKRFFRDMHAMYEEGLLSDFTLCAGNKSFPVHKSILSARSPVFKTMFTTPLKEKDGHSLDIPDIDADALHRMLLFVYSNETEDLEWEDAINLYFAADKYDIEDLKSATRSILKSKLSVPNVCDVLVHADLHEDGDLKCSVMEFIVSHDEEIIGSENWKKFQKSHMPLAMEVFSVLYTKMKKRNE